MLSRIKNRLIAVCCKNPALLVLLIFAGLYFIAYYITDPVRPTGMFPNIFGYKDSGIYTNGWWGYYDQGSYIKLAHSLASFNFHELIHTYTYGLGYPLVAVPFIWIGLAKDPFLFFNLFSFVFAIYATYRFAEKVISPRAGFLAGFGLLFATPLIVYTAQPWNSTICLTAMSALLLIARKDIIKPRHALILGLMAGMVFAARYIDMLWFLLLAPPALYRGKLKELIISGVIFVLATSIVVAPVLYSHYKVFGSPLSTPYSKHLGINDNSSDQQADAYKINRIPKAALAMFVSPRLAGSKDVDRGAIISMFWVLAAFPGLYIILKDKRSRGYRLFLGSLFITSILAYLFYLSFRASGADSLKYGILHYFKMFWPGFVILSVAFFEWTLSLTTQSTKVTGKKP